MIERPDHPRRPLGVHLVCEACAEETLVILPTVRGRYGIVDCPHCNTTYLLSLTDRRDEASRQPPKSA